MDMYHISRIFRDFPEDTAKNKPNYTASLRVFDIAKIGLTKKLTLLPSVVFAKIYRREKFPIYGICMGKYIWHPPGKE